MVVLANKMLHIPTYKPRMPLDVKRSLQENSVSPSPPSSTTKALSSIVAILGVVIIAGVVIWRVKVYRNMVRQRASTDTLVTMSELEKNDAPSSCNSTAGAVSKPFVVTTQIHVDTSSGPSPNNPSASPALSLTTSTLCSNPQSPKLELLRMSFPNIHLDPNAHWKTQAKECHPDQENNRHGRERLASVNSGAPLDRPVGDGNAGSISMSHPNSPKEDHEKGEFISRKPIASPPPSYISSNAYNDLLAPNLTLSPLSKIVVHSPLASQGQQDARFRDKNSVGTGPVSTSEPKSKPKPKRWSSLKPISIPPPSSKLPPIPVQSPMSAATISPSATTPRTPTIIMPDTATPNSAALHSRFSLYSVSDFHDAPLPSPARSESFAVRDLGFAGSPTLQVYAKATIQLPSSALVRGVSPSIRSSDASAFSALSVPGVVSTATRVSATTASTTLRQLDRSPFGSSSETISSANLLSSKLPRPMSVVAMFTPSLEDEMPLKTGETVRMISEFEDGWCLVERLVVGPKRGSDQGVVDVMDGVRKGVCPRFCLGEVKVL